MKTIEQLTKTELSLLLYFETCAVDKQGRVNSQHMNDEDREIAKRWHAEGFVSYGRVCHDDFSREAGNLWCHLSEQAWDLAHEARQQRAVRSWERRNWMTTEENRTATQF